MGCLGWSPDDFWGATLKEIELAYEGYANNNGIDLNEPEPFLRDDYEKLKLTLERKGKL